MAKWLLNELFTTFPLVTFADLSKKGRTYRRFILRQLGHLLEDPPLSAPPSQGGWLYRDNYYLMTVSNIKTCNIDAD